VAIGVINLAFAASLAVGSYTNALASLAPLASLASLAAVLTVFVLST
jgi:hypothetical protein